MKKYKLKKDLPTWKAGEEFWIGEDECLYGVSEEGEPIMVYHAITLVNFGLLKNGEWFEEIEEKPKSIWNLEGGDYYFLIKDGIVDDCIIYNYGLMEKSRELGDVFVTREEAEKELEKRKAIQKIKKYCWENGIETDYKKIENGKFCYLIAYDFLNDRLSIIRISEVNIFYSPIGYFSEENAEKILENFEEELKIILDI